MSFVYRLQPDAWLGGILEREAYTLALAQAGSDRPGTGFSGDFRPLRDLLHREVFVSAKVAVADLEACHALESLGFRLIDTNVQFEKTLPDRAMPPQGCLVRSAVPSDQEAVAGIAGSSIIFSRFHLDPRIPRQVADLLKAEWTRNFFRGSRGQAMIVAEHEGTVAGFLQALRPEPATLIIDLIATDRRFQRRGIASAMCRFLETLFPEARRARVGTQVANTPSLLLYTRLGYAFASAQYVFHHHGAGAGGGEP